MAQGSGRSRGTGKNGGNGPKGKSGVQPSARKPAKSGATASRTSVAAARSSRSNNRTQLIIGGVAIALIAAVVVIGIMMNRSNTAVQADGYGASTNSVTTVNGNVMTISSATPPAGTTPVTIDLYADALCPICGQFERQYGQQINQAVDQGKLVVNLHMLNFLDRGSFSKDYSSRAAGALLCVAQNQGSTPGLVLSYYTKLFAEGTQPEEQGTSDLTNAQLADLAKGLGANDTSTSCISAGSSVAAAQANATASSATLQGIVGGVRTPSVVHDGQIVNINQTTWLSTLLGS
ncbi:serine/threonine protein kinase [Nakamurella flava]|uniref:Serine/threonine protein kinase n=1 Tax=Nakamurella flava TaxID=2576308 RepID=A0A4U6QMP8_9ACTN|nr:thioredoxin domain-containing protein [Nakamurella flava]TKV61302.1 serine/threonine protein kinase [Nakamurella flava]